MRKMVELMGRDLRWVRTHALRLEYELRAGDEVAATLRVSGLFRDHAAAESADGCWMFERVGFWRNKVRVRVCRAESDTAIFKFSRWGDGSGVLQLPGGQKLYATANFWRTEYEFKSVAGEPMLRISSVGLLRENARVDLHAGAERLPELVWLVMLGWYLMLTMSVGAATMR